MPKNIVHIDTKQLHGMNLYRGVGVYTELLFEALTELVQDDQDWEVQLVSKSTKQRPDLTHYPFFDLFFLTLPTQPKPFVTTIHDVIPLLYPSEFRPGIRGKLKYYLQRTRLGSANGIITDSDRSRKDIVQHLGVPASKVHRVYLAGNPRITKQPIEMVRQVRQKYHLPPKYLLYIGDINPNKNLPLLLEAYSGLSSAPPLVLLGRSMKNTEIPEGKAIQQKLDSLNLRDSVILLDSVPKSPIEDLAAILTGAQVYVQPSLYEGFGFPVLDAFQTETVVCSSTGGSLSEVIGKAAIAFDPKSKTSIQRALNRSLQLNAVDRRLLQRLGTEQQKQFSWKQTARETLKVYANVITSSRKS